MLRWPASCEGAPDPRAVEEFGEEAQRDASRLQRASQRARDGSARIPPPWSQLSRLNTLSTSAGLTAHHTRGAGCANTRHKSAFCGT